MMMACFAGCVPQENDAIEGQAVSDYLGGDMRLHFDKENAITRDISRVGTAGTYALEDAANVSITLDDEKYLS
ncbi:MAG: hypothetical protein RR193_03245, partial [Christensenellaceae bacterium]